MNVNELYKFVEDFYGYKCEMIYLDDEDLEVSGILYSSFIVMCNIDKRHGFYNAWIKIDNNFSVGGFANERWTIKTGTEELKKTLQYIDDYCRLRLPDKFLDAFETAHQAYLDSLYDDIL